MSPDTLFGCLYHSLITLRLSKLIQMTTDNNKSSNTTVGYTHRQLLQILLNPTYYPIGIQIRTNDDVFKQTIESMYKPEQFSAYFNCAQQLSQQNSNSVTYLMSDTSQLRREALKYFNNTNTFHLIAHVDRVLHMQVTKHLVEQALSSALFDAFLYMMCEHHIICDDSGYGRFAAFAGLKRRSIFAFTGSSQNTNRLICSNNGGTLLKEAGRRWSGIK
ncbi:unnamed protein product [Didymodactylos carnosus]|uniref:Uncharacterized protein n=1 Tax=Didymodactylos carnosus TaxID=1234261 RepID=A0A815H1I9_9BILA|nr:unnamed protein product [Didymodactylos carnosus]CAF4215605.1 unnamed protein product [Didymodactylos carnosus]